MTKTEEHFAKESARLLSDAVLMSAFAAVRSGALMALAEVDPDNKTEILRLQAIAKCINDVRDALQSAILATGKSDGGFNPNERPETSTASILAAREFDLR